MHILTGSLFMKHVKLPIFSTLLLLISAASSYAVDLPKSKVIGGTPSVVGSTEWMVSVQYIPQGADNIFMPSHICGGTLIEPAWVLTAAHCVEQGSPHEVVVTIGLENLSSQGFSDRFPVDQIIIERNYDDNTLDNDIALLHLTRNSNQPLITLASQTETSSLSQGQPLNLVGFGIYESGGTQVSDRLLSAVLPYVTPGNCSSNFPSGWVTGNMICAGGESGIDSCSGDSGGPLYEGSGNSAIQHGIVSWGIGCDTGEPGVYTRVANYRNWIDQRTQGLTISDPIRLPFMAQGISQQIVLPLVNNSDADIAVSGISTSDPNQYQASADCVTTLPAATTCAMNLTAQADVAGTQTSELQVITAQGSYSAEIISSVLAEDSFSADLEQNRLRWFTGGDIRWRDSNVKGPSGGDAIEASFGPLDSGRAALMVLSNVSGELSFRWRIEGDANALQLLNLYRQQGNLEEALITLNAWTSVSTPLQAGEPVTIDFTSSGDGKGLIADVVFVPEDDSVEPPSDGGTTAGSGGGGGGGGGGSLGYLTLFALILLSARNVTKRRFMC
jgi:trypsin